MKGLKLSNRFVDGKLENLCYLNASLNLFSSSTFFSNFFKERVYLLAGQSLQSYPVSSELSNIFNSPKGDVTSAGKLREIIAEKSGKFDNWDQQDITEFHSTFLEVLETEFKTNNCQVGRELLNKFIGLEKCELSFVNVCNICNYKPEDSLTEFKILSLDIFSSVPGCTVSQLIQQHYQSVDMRKLRCECEGSDNKDVRVSSSISEEPENLIIELRRYKAIAGNQEKCKNVIKLDSTLLLPSGGDYTLAAVVDHRGSTIQSGHYISFIKSENHWIILDDDVVTKVPAYFYPVDGPDNVLLHYSKSEAVSSPVIENKNLLDIDIITPAKSARDKVPCHYSKSQGVKSSPVIDNKNIPDIEIITPAESARDKVPCHYSKSQAVKSSPVIDNKNIPDIEIMTPAESVCDKVPCLNCGKKYKHIFPHIEKFPRCKEKYNFEMERESYKKYRNKLKNQSKSRAKERDSEGFVQKNQSSVAAHLTSNPSYLIRKSCLFSILDRQTVFPHFLNSLLSVRLNR